MAGFAGPPRGGGALFVGNESGGIAFGAQDVYRTDWPGVVAPPRLPLQRRREPAATRARIAQRARTRLVWSSQRTSVADVMTEIQRLTIRISEMITRPQLALQLADVGRTDQPVPPPLLLPPIHDQLRSSPPICARNSIPGSSEKRAQVPGFVPPARRTNPPIDLRRMTEHAR